MKELQSVLGMVNYLKTFLPNIVVIVEPMKALLRKIVGGYRVVIVKWHLIH